MSLTRSFGLVFAAGAALFAAQAASASDRSTFRDFEHHHRGVARVEVARESLARAIPAGTSLADARATLREAGAFCGSSDRCSFMSFESNHDMLHSVAWSVDLNHQDGKVSHLTVSRETYGS